jgi:hypothetical protein
MHFLTPPCHACGKRAPRRTPPPPAAQTPLEWIDTPARLRELVSELDGIRHLAFDVENHSRRSYAGTTCVLQLSTGVGDLSGAGRTRNPQEQHRNNTGMAWEQYRNGIGLD